MATTVCRWGNSLAIRLPRPLAEQADLTEGAAVELRVGQGGLVIRRRRQRPKLAELLRRAKGPSPHRAPDADRAIGGAMP